MHYTVHDIVHYIEFYQLAAKQRAHRRVAASLTYGCSLAHLRLQPRRPTVAASLTYGCSLAHLRLQAHREEDGEAMSAVAAKEDDDDDAPQSPQSVSMDKSFNHSRDKSRDQTRAVDGTVVEADAKGKKGETQKKEKEADPMRRLFQHISPGDGKYYVLGTVCGGLTGVGKGLFGLLMMRTMTALSPADPDEIREQARHHHCIVHCIVQAQTRSGSRRGTTIAYCIA